MRGWTIPRPRLLRYASSDQAYDRSARDGASKAPTMKIAIVGKGGSGKTTVAGTLARVFADEGHKILAIDGDPNPNLALTPSGNGVLEHDAPIGRNAELLRGHEKHLRLRLAAL